MQYLLQSGHRVLFAGNDWQRAYISATMPEVPCIHLDGYDVSYASSGRMFMMAIARQVPSILKTVRDERNWLRNVIKEHGIDIVISDNRYGLYNMDIPCVIMTHQLNAMSGLGKSIDKLVRKIHYKRLEQFDQCWIVDASKPPGLAGLLAHPLKLPKNAQYIGLLSQAEATTTTVSPHLLILLSGPEPQRGILSDKIWKELQAYKGAVVFTEGKAKAPKRESTQPNVHHYTMLTRDKLKEAIQNADMVICRSGYSTVMDLVKLGKKAIFIPTPGQTEQEYLAKDLQQQGMYPYMEQNEFELHAALKIAETFPYNKPITVDAFSMYQRAIDELLKLG